MSDTRIVEIECGPGGLAVKAYLVLGERPILVDTGLPGSADHILAKLACEGHVPRDVSLIILTHAHADHTGSVRELAQRTGAPVAIHEADADYLRQGTSAPMRGRSLIGRLLASVLGGARSRRSEPDLSYEPDIILHDSHSLESWGVDGRVEHTPGHTSGSTSVFVNGGDAIVGDLLSSAFMRKSTPAPGMFALDPAAMDESIKGVLARGPRLTHACHCAPFTLAMLEAAFAV